MTPAGLTFRTVAVLHAAPVLFLTLASPPLHADSPTTSPRAAVAQQPPGDIQCAALPYRFLEVGDVLPAPRGFDGLALYDTEHQESLLDVPLKSGSWRVSPDDHERVRALKAEDSLEQPRILLAWTRTVGPQSPPCTQKFDIARTVVGGVLCPDLDNRATCVQSLGGRIVVEVWDLDVWVATATKDARPVSERRSGLVLFLDGAPLPGVHPDNPNAQVAYWNAGHKVTRLHFTLTRSDANRAAWTRLLTGFQWNNRSLNVSVGLPTGEMMASDVGPHSQHSEPYRTFELSVVPHGEAFVASLVFLIALGAFFVLAAKTTIVRDTAAANRPDGNSPLSLARMQMAFWSFLVTAAYLFLFLVTKDANTLTTSVLVLMGISAATAVSAALIGQDPTQDRNFNRPNVSDPKNPAAAAETLRQEVKKLEDKLKTASGSHASKLQNEIDLTRNQVRFFSRRKVMRGLYDLLGEDGNISFHRFQIAVWTLVLGLIFVIRVYNDLGMPDFSATLLGLMGISSGTYVGYKLAPAKPTPASPGQ